MNKKAAGSLVIIDISGFTRLVSSVSSGEGVCILQRLLENIIATNQLDLSISEIEGDAILFYKLGEAMPTAVILNQFDAMLQAFRTEVAAIQPLHPVIASLSIKAFVHYGELTTYEVGGFEKLYGKALIDIHRLLKNTVGRDTYVLMTNDYLRAAGKAGCLEHGWYDDERCDCYDLGNLCYHYYFHGQEDNIGSYESTNVDTPYTNLDMCLSQ